MSQSYEERLRIPMEGRPLMRFETRDGKHIATGYIRIVIGDRGPYIEFGPENIVKGSLHIPRSTIWRQGSRKAFYIEYRSACPSFVKVYLQKRSVDYADYKKGLYYISPFDLLANGQTIIEPKKNTPKVRRLI